MIKPFIKICGIRDPAIATAAIMAGANFIGIIFHPGSKRYVNLNDALKIAKATIQAGAIPVAIFVNQTDQEMHHICEATQIKMIQLHGDISRAHHHLLSDDLQRIYALSHLENKQGLQYLRSDRDFILMDHPSPGQGNRLSWSTLNYELPFRWFLAGGLTSANVHDAFNTLKPDGIDVSSGVESSKGVKDRLLIQQFIHSIRGSHHEK